MYIGTNGFLVSFGSSSIWNTIEKRRIFYSNIMIGKYNDWLSAENSVFPTLSDIALRNAHM